jgi:hypothetical protein
MFLPNVYSTINRKRNLTIGQSLSSILSEYVLNNVEQNSKNFLYILANVRNNKQLKYWTKIQRLFRGKKNRLKVR